MTLGYWKVLWDERYHNADATNRKLNQYIISGEHCERMNETLVGGIRRKMKDILYLVLNYPYSTVVHPSTVHSLCLWHAKNLIYVFIQPPAPRPRRTCLAVLAMGNARLLVIDNETFQLRELLQDNRGRFLIFFELLPLPSVVRLGSFRAPEEDRISAAPLPSICTKTKICCRRETKFFQVGKLGQDCQDVLQECLIMVSSYPFIHI